MNNKKMSDKDYVFKPLEIPEDIPEDIRKFQEDFNSYMEQLWEDRKKMEKDLEFANDWTKEDLLKERDKTLKEVRSLSKEIGDFLEEMERDSKELEQKNKKLGK